MTVNLAIVVGVSNYLDEKNTLPACKNDISIMQDLLAGSGKFSEIFVVPEGDGKFVKTRIAEFIARFKDEEVGELFFYFTGHGEFVDEEFRYLLRDYSRTKPAQTSLSNSELDNFLRSVSANLVVKVVDACYSGMPYIKDGSSFTDYMKTATEKSFSKCYFFFGSQSDQKSWASAEISDFTRVFVETIAESSLESIRYKDVIDALSDAFQDNSRQRPLFVVQGDFTEILGAFQEPVRARLKEHLASFSSAHSEQAMSSKMSVADIARSQAQQYVSMEAAIDAVDAVRALLEKITLESETGRLFIVEKKFFENLYGLPSQATLGKWLSKNDEQFFASPTYETEEYEVDSPWETIIGLAANGAVKKIKKTRQVIAGIQANIPNLSFYSALILLKPTLPNLTQYGGWFAYLLSKTTFQAFFCFVEYKEVLWGEFRGAKNTEWTQGSFKLAQSDGGAEIVETFVSEFESYVEAKVAERLGVGIENPGSEPQA